MTSSWQRLGNLIRRLRLGRGLGQKEVVSALPFQYSIRSLARVESGQRRPSREMLIGIVINGLKLSDAERVNRLLGAADYAGLSNEETRHYHLTRSREPQKTRWAPTDGKAPGIDVEGDSDSDFIPWDELKPEIEARLLNQLGLHIPPECTVILDDFHGRPNWLVRIVDSECNRRGYVWFGTDADNNWAFDGLVRAGDDTYVVWAVFQRYSDGSYRRIRVQQPRSLRPTERRPIPQN
jgi:transcriptional regulator with XRE-family HTH domain